MHRRFPGVDTCVEALRRPGTRGGLVDVICGELRDNAATHAEEMIAAFCRETDGRIRCLLLAALGEASVGEAFSLFVEQLRSEDEGLRTWAAFGLHKLDTKEARQALWDARSQRFDDAAETRRFQEMLERVRKWK